MTHSDFAQCAKTLDNRRLVKQVTEGLQIYTAASGKSTKKGWVHHPAVKQWVGFDQALIEYIICIATECQARGYKFQDGVKNLMEIYNKDHNNYPQWIYDERVHRTHRSRLLLKGKVDQVVASIKMHYGVRNMTEWLEQHGFPVMNLIRRPSLDMLILYCMRECVDPFSSSPASYYERFNWNIPDDLDYYWPSKTS